MKITLLIKKSNGSSCGFNSLKKLIRPEFVSASNIHATSKVFLKDNATSSNSNLKRIKPSFFEARQLTTATLKKISA